MYAIASKTGTTIHLFGLNGFTLCGRVILDSTDDGSGMKLCQRCNRADLKANPITVESETVVPVTDVEAGQIVMDSEAIETEIKAEYPGECATGKGDDAIIIDTAELPMAHAQFVAWFRRHRDFEAKDAIISDHSAALEEDARINEAYAGRAEDVTNRQRDVLKVKVAPVETVSVSDRNPIDDVIRFARKSIKALTPTLLATKTVFESLRDDESANPAYVDLAYQVYCDTFRSIEEYQRTIAYAAGEHDCNAHYSEIAMTEECAYGCKIYRCGKCQDEATLHNPTYGCRYTA